MLVRKYPSLEQWWEKENWNIVLCQTPRKGRDIHHHAIKSWKGTVNLEECSLLALFFLPDLCLTLKRANRKRRTVCATAWELWLALEMISLSMEDQVRTQHLQLFCYNYSLERLEPGSRQSCPMIQFRRHDWSNYRLSRLSSLPGCYLAMRQGRRNDVRDYALNTGSP